MRLARTVAEVLDATRNQGHTYFLGAVMRQFESSDSRHRCLFLTAEEARRFHRAHSIVRGDIDPRRCLSIDAPMQVFRGVHGPLLVDLHVLQQLASDAFTLHADAQRELAAARAQVEQANYAVLVGRSELASRTAEARRATARTAEARRATARAAESAREVLDLRAQLVKARAKQRKTAAALRKAKRRT